MPYCTGCVAKLKEGDKLCHICGQAVTRKTLSEFDMLLLSMSREKKLSRKIVETVRGIVWVIFFFMGIGIGGVFGYVVASYIKTGSNPITRAPIMQFAMFSLPLILGLPLYFFKRTRDLAETLIAAWGIATFGSLVLSLLGFIG